MLTLVKTLAEITLLRRGPEHLPRSVVLLGMTVSLWLFAALAALALIEQFSEADFFLSVFSAFVGILCYATIIFLYGYGPRTLQTVSAIIGVGGLITLVFVVEYVLLKPFLGAANAGFIATLILFWSVPVEGHIVSRAIERHWYVGILLALGVFVFQYLTNSLLTTTGQAS